MVESKDNKPPCVNTEHAGYIPISGPNPIVSKESETLPSTKSSTEEEKTAESSVNLGDGEHPEEEDQRTRVFQSVDESAQCGKS